MKIVFLLLSTISAVMAVTAMGTNVGIHAYQSARHHRYLQNRKFGQHRARGKRPGKAMPLATLLSQIRVTGNNLRKFQEMLNITNGYKS